MKIRICRPDGGLGDVVTCLAALKGLGWTHPSAERVFFSHRAYADVLERCPDVDRWHHTTDDDSQRRPRFAPIDDTKYPYLRQEPGPWGLTVDLWCPAWAHEAMQWGAVTKSRLQVFAETAGVWGAIRHDPRPRLRLTAQDRREACEFIARNGLDPDRTVGWQPFPTDLSRRWPPGFVSVCIGALKGKGYETLVFDCTTDRPKAIDGGARCLCMPIGTVAAIVSMLPLVICPDSSFMHLCAADGVDAPCLSLHGKTGGDIAQAPYPLGNWLQGRPVDCGAPCWHRPNYGYDSDRCRAHGCNALSNIPPEAVLSAVERILRGERVGEHVGAGAAAP